MTERGELGVMVAELQSESDGGLVLRVGPTAAFERAELAAARSLLELVFEHDFSEHDWDHALGGLHVMTARGGALVGHAALVSRRLLYAGRALRAGYVEALAVHPSQRRAGVGSRMMRVLESAVAQSSDLGALSATDEGAAFYAKRGWQQWRGPLSALTPQGVLPTPDEAGGIYVLPAALELDLHAPLCADYREGDIW